MSDTGSTVRVPLTRTGGPTSNAKVSTTSTIARRYAKALFDLAVEANRVDDAILQLDAHAKAVAGDPALFDLLASPSLERGERLKVAETLIASRPTDPYLASGLRLLAERGRLGMLGEVARRLKALADERAGIVRATLTSAVPMSDASAEAIARKLSQALKATVLVERAVDASLVGGVVATVGDLRFDGSLKTQLEELKRQLKGS